ncbi:MAG: hypothetical protein Q4A73_05885, partial [Campylobacter sp.]|nr:hypothetical protein [Campylobacter sp.]
AEEAPDEAEQSLEEIATGVPNAEPDEPVDSHQEPLPVVEEQEAQINFDDLPSDAEFLGQSKGEDAAAEEFEPSVEELSGEEDEPLNLGLNAQDQIKDTLAQLDEMDLQIPQDNGSKVLEDFKDEPVLDHESLGTHDEELVVPDIIKGNDFDSLQESQIKQALGESVDDGTDAENLEGQSETIVHELSQSIAGAISSSINDDTLKAALRGMNMKINISISFDENKH